MKISKYIVGRTVVLTAFLVIINAVLLYGQEKAATGKQKAVNITVRVTDENGNPLGKAAITVGEGIQHKETDQSGMVNLTLQNENEFVTVAYPGYEPAVLRLADIAGQPGIKLVKSKYFMTADDEIELPFMTIKKRYLTGSSSKIYAGSLEKYPSSDIRNSLAGLVTGMEVLELNGSPGISAEEKLNLYGATEKIQLLSRGSSLSYIIDGVRMDITEMPLDPGEIESVTLVRDIVGKNLYGPAVGNGFLVIRTKRGKMNERLLNLNLEQGVSTIDRFPQWVSGADYAKLNNIAKTNSGITSGLFTEDDITAFSSNDPYDMNHPSVNYRDLLIKENRGFTRLNVSSSGGNEGMQYSAYLGYTGEGDNFRVGANAGYTRLNARSNIDIKINEFLKVQLNFAAGISLRDSPNYGYATSEGSSAMSLTEMPSLLNDITSISPVAFPLYVNNDPALKSPWYAVSSQFSVNPLGSLVKSGSYTESGRSGMVNSLIQWNILPGLKSSTFVDLNTYYLLRVGKAENYTAYRIDPRTYDPNVGITSLTKSWDGVDATAKSNLHDYYYQNYAVYENLSYEKKLGRNYMLGAATFRNSSIKRNGFEEPQRELGLIFTALYSFDDKYTVQGVLNYAGTSGLSPDHFYSLLPSVGAGWIISEENFMKNQHLFDYLKIRGEFGETKVDNFMTPFRYRDNWSVGAGSANTNKFGTYYSNTGTWIGVYRQSGNNNYTYPSRTGNPDLDLERRREYNFGIDAVMFKNKISIEANYYYNLRYDVITTRPNLTPVISGTTNALPYVNYNSFSYRGLELGISYKNRAGDLFYMIGVNGFTQKAIVEQLDEPNYRNDYQRLTGGPADAIRGLLYLGRFASDEEALAVPQFGETLHAGDLKYEDKNGDGVVDDNDAQYIGHSTPKLYYALNLNIMWKNLELTVIGAGRALYDIMLNNKYFTCGAGDNTYSKFILDDIDENGLGNKYPRITYYQVANNFKTSSFRLAGGGYFKMQNIELAWNVPVQNLQWWKGVRGIRIYARGANLFTMSKITDVDPENIDSGISTYPLNRTFTGGLKLTF